MEFTKENMRFYIFTRYQLDESPKLIHETLQTVCGECACSYQTVCGWVKEFNEGDETWFAFFIIPPKRLNRMWVDGQGDRPVVLLPGFQSRKRMFTVSFNYSGPHAVDLLPQNTTMTATLYVQNVLSQVKSAINGQRPKVSTSRTLLRHDNSGPCKARATTQSLRELGIQVFPHPAYSPDLSPCDFWLFPILKDRLAGRKFDRIQDLLKAVNSELRTIPEENYRGVFRKWQIRLKRWIESHLEYFGGL
ncbi:transposase [Elysia marginata]|uniref:Transposase n=1 Tax=Elysia marginata TaxID=1093978 RepID=A0AAV4G4M1_9GAST|nr:transposase [Elysia marginata]